MSMASAIRLVLLGAIWGSSFLFMKVAVPAFGPAALIEIRLALAAILLAIVAASIGRKLDWKTNWRHHMIIGGINSALPFLCFAYAAQSLPASLLALFNSLAPIFGAIVASVWLSTAITRATVVGLACGVGGVAVLTFDHIEHATVGANAFDVAMALAAAAVAPLCYGIAATYIKWSSSAVDPFSNAHGAMWSAALLALPLAILFPPTAVAPPEAIGAVAILGLVCTGAAYLLQFKLFADLGPTRGLTVTFLIPVFGVLWGVALLGEPIGWSLVGGGTLILVGTAVVTGAIDFNRTSKETRKVA